MLIAKTCPTQSLQEHSQDTCDVLSSLAEKLLPIWRHRLLAIGCFPENLLELLGSMAMCHDLGKAMDPWQRFIRGQGPWTGHALFSMILANHALKGNPSLNRTAILLAILSHHGQLNNDSFQGSRLATQGKISFDKDMVNTMLQELGAFNPLTISSLIAADCSKAVSSLKDSLGQMQDNKLQFKALFCFYHTLLRLADNEASARHKGSRSMIRSCADAAVGFSSSLPATSPNTVQRQVSGNHSLLILRAACGVGKTGAALKFAMEHIQAGRADRVIFTLPTQFTSNSMYWDLETKYGIPKDLSGIYHSEIEMILKKESDDEDYRKAEKYQNTFYHKPVTISTVDHLLYSLLHGYKFADRAFGNIFTSVVIIDEVHYYDNFTLQKIGQSLELMRNLHIPHLIMTATMPQVILDRLQKDANGKYTVVTQQEGAELKSFNIVRMESTIVTNERVSPDLVRLIRHNRYCKQMVVVNTVTLAKKIAKTIKLSFEGINILCYHAQFCRQHRADKERLIKILFAPISERTPEDIQLLKTWNFANIEEVVLVSTQVCELSLDISADVMYSQIAPVDSIVQRGGRLHRKGTALIKGTCTCSSCRNRHYLKNDHQYSLYLFPLDWEDEKSFLPYDKQREIIIDSWDSIGGEYSFAAAAEWVDRVFTKAPLLRDAEMNKMILEDVVFGRTPAERYGAEDAETSAGIFRVRDIEQAMLTVIPYCYRGEALANEEDAYLEFGVKTPIWIFRKYGHKEGDFWFLDCPYSREWGFEPEDMNK